MKQFACLFLLSISFTVVKAQQLFIPNGTIVYEKKVNLQRLLADSGYPEDSKERIKKYKTSNWELSFNTNKSIYRLSKKNDDNIDASFFGHTEDIENELYADYHEHKRVIKKNIMGEDYLLKDTIPKISWKIVHEVRNIAGYECRKAVGIIDDSVYVVAFYTDEILLKAGPEGFNGLPGMILGLAIPRYYSTWFATKVTPYSELSLSITQPTKGKKTETEKDFKKMIEVFTRYDEPKKQNPEVAKKRLYGFIL